MKALVIGDLMVDHYLWGGCERISAEAPVQVVDVNQETQVLGGAGNVVNNLVALGIETTLATVVGDDATAEQAKALLQASGVQHKLVAEPQRATTKKSRVMVKKAQVLRFDNETRQAISSASASKLLQHIEAELEQFDIVLISDYGKGVCTTELLAGVMSSAAKRGIKVLVDPKGQDYAKYRGAYLLTPNRGEVELATGTKISDEASLIEALQQMQNTTASEVAMATLSEDGIALYDGALKVMPTVAKEVYDVTGAGDTVIAALAYALVNEFEISEAVEFANMAAGVVVGKIGSATVTLDEIEQYRSSLHRSTVDSHIKSTAEIVALVETLKQQNKKIVFTNGCFDILHRGHVSYLETARSFGDVLVLGLNTDASVKRLKGEGRPVNSEEDRAFILAALESVDYVVLFDQDTPYELIKQIRPDILVKGADYSNQQVVGSDIAGEVRLVEFVDGKSTTSTIAKIKEASHA
jgi:D-beta-D-heptose 7-phosphate kinase/D-beta-D-heptose 1-phosphate adenosyltransferase